MRLQALQSEYEEHKKWGINKTDEDKEGGPPRVQHVQMTHAANDRRPGGGR